MRPQRGEKSRNIKRVESLLSGVSADIIVLPELFNTGYLFESRDELFALAEPFKSGETFRSLSAISSSNGFAIAAGFAERAGDALDGGAMPLALGAMDVFEGILAQDALGDPAGALPPVEQTVIWPEQGGEQAHANKAEDEGEKGIDHECVRMRSGRTTRMVGHTRGGWFQKEMVFRTD